MVLDVPELLKWLNM